MAEWRRLDKEETSQKEADALEAMAGIFKGTPGAAYPFAGLINPSGNDSAQNGTFSATTPPGLRNIGNTCYLNSLLQYFYNVRPIRDLVLNYDEFRLELDDESVKERRTGGSGITVELEEAIVARQCKSSGNLWFSIIV